MLEFPAQNNNQNDVQVLLREMQNAHWLLTPQPQRWTLVSDHTRPNPLCPQCGIVGSQVVKEWLCQLSLARCCSAAGHGNTAHMTTPAGWIKVCSVWRLDSAHKHKHTSVHSRLSFSCDLFWLPHLDTPAGDEWASKSSLSCPKCECKQKWLLTVFWSATF